MVAASPATRRLVLFFGSSFPLSHGELGMNLAQMACGRMRIDRVREKILHFFIGLSRFLGLALVAVALGFAISLLGFLSLLVFRDDRSYQEDDVRIRKVRSRCPIGWTWSRASRGRR